MPVGADEPYGGVAGTMSECTDSPVIRAQDGTVIDVAGQGDQTVNGVALTERVGLMGGH